jgi:hypothetical protein
VRATKNYSLTLNANKFLTIIVFVDASFAVHPNYRSHTGAAVTLFRGVLWAKSSKQKLTTKSSTEAELVAISDIIGQVVWMTNFLEAQGYKLPPPKMFEDNLSTIALIKNESLTLTGLDILRYDTSLLLRKLLIKKSILNIRLQMICWQVY